MNDKESIWNRLEKAIPDDKERERICAAANFRLTFNAEEYLKVGTRFCQRCGWRSGMGKYCNLCSECEQCRFPKSNCHCDDPKLQKHVEDLIKDYEAAKKTERPFRTRNLFG